MRRGGTFALPLLLLIALNGPAAAQEKAPPDDVPRRVAIDAKPIRSFSTTEPDRIRFGALEFRGGLVLTSDDERFGGLSGLRFLSDNEFLAVNDRGRWLRARLLFEDGKPSGIGEATIAPMLDGKGGLLADGRSLDTESIALAEGGDVLVGIERVHRVVRYDFAKRGFAARASNVAAPGTLRDLPKNAGIEGLVFVPRDRPLGGTIVAFAERALDRNENLRAFLIGGPSPGEFSVLRSDGFDITDAALIPGGDVLILERYFSWFGALAMRIRRIRLEEIRPGATVEGTILIHAGGGYEVDNMEGIAAQRGPDGETLITVVSDDNFFSLQRTLLLRFALVEH